MIMNQKKMLSQLKELILKHYKDKNIQVSLSKEWTNIFQKLTYVQIQTLRKFYADDNIKSSKDVENPSIKKPEENTVEKKLVVNEDTPKKDYIENHVKNDISIDLRDQVYNLPHVISTIIPKLKPKTKVSSSSTPRWKNNVQLNTISKQSIVSRTKHILNSIQEATSDLSKAKRIEDFILHLEQYNDARHYAIKDNAIGVLLKLRQSHNNEDIQASLKEALALLGHVDPLPGRGIRILSIDGGGIRGIVVIEILKKIEEITGKQVFELFDYICGVSTGAILSGVLVKAMETQEGGQKKKSLKEISDLYKEMSIKVFTQNSLRGTSNLVLSHAYYDTDLWEQLLQEHIGNTSLIKTVREPNTPKFSAVSAVINHSNVMAYIFRNYTFPYGMESQYTGCHKHELWEIARASAAAPTYFEEYKCREFLHQDGGIMVNNPTAVAIHEAKQLWPNSHIQCVISCGTGRAPCNLNDIPMVEYKEIPGTSSWKDKFYKILQSATDTEAVHTTLNDLLPDDVYFRFNPYLTEMLSMTEIRPEKISQLELDSLMYIRRNDEKFKIAAKALMQKRKFTQKFNDWLILQKQLYF